MEVVGRARSLAFDLLKAAAVASSVMMDVGKSRLAHAAPLLRVHRVNVHEPAECPGERRTSDHM